MTQKLAIRVTMGANGKQPQRELMLDGMKIADLSFIETVEFVMQATSSLRFERRDGGSAGG